MGLQSYVTQLAINRSRCCSEMGRAAGGGGGARGAGLPFLTAGSVRHLAAWLGSLRPWGAWRKERGFELGPA